MLKLAQLLFIKYTRIIPIIRHTRAPVIIGLHGAIKIKKNILKNGHNLDNIQMQFYRHRTTS